MFTPARKPRVPWKLILLVGAGYGLLMSVQVRLSSTLGGHPIPWSKCFALQLPVAVAWILATPWILRLGRRFPLTREQWRTSVPILVAISLGFVFALDMATAWYSTLVLPPGPNATSLLRSATRSFVIWVFSDLLTWWSILAVSYAVEHYQRLRERELAAAQLETQLSQAELKALKSQLHPHFLFNALHTIGSLVRTGDRENAVKVTAGLGELLRRMLEGAAQQEVPLRQELDFIKSYLEIEQIRFRDRLQVCFDVDPGVADARVPHLILQPLVENAIRHGIAPHLSAGRLVVRAAKANGKLQLVVKDDGPGTGDEDDGRPGIGLANTRARLARLYGNEYLLEVGNLPQGGVQARLEFPFRLATAEWEGSA